MVFCSMVAVVANRVFSHSTLLNLLLFLRFRFLLCMCLFSSEEDKVLFEPNSTSKHDNQMSMAGLFLISHQ